LEGSDQVIAFEKKLEHQFRLHEEYLTLKGFRLSPLHTFYIGGGTPSLWGKRGVEFIHDLFQKNIISLRNENEFTIEVDPDAWSESEIEKWIDLGVNRFSIGVQAFSDKFMQIMDRTHSLADVKKTLDFFSQRNLNFSVDLMIGLPHSEDRDLSSELSELIKYHPNHFSVYILKTRKNYPLKVQLPSDDLIRDEYLKVCNILKSFGYEQYEVSNFARDGFFSKHNMNYWHYQSVAGIGPNATGLLVSDEGNVATRYQWKSVGQGVSEEVLRGTSLIIEKLFLGLRFKHGFNPYELFRRESDALILNQLFLDWKEKGYLAEKSKKDELYLTSLGYLMCDSLIDDIFKEIDF
jgi:oxygen-independent coproporphyrinogen-3 oxidase